MHSHPQSGKSLRTTVISTPYSLQLYWDARYWMPIAFNGVAWKVVLSPSYSSWQKTVEEAGVLTSGEAATWEGARKVDVVSTASRAAAPIFFAGARRMTYRP